MTMTPSPRLRAARRASSVLAAGLGAALVTVVVVAGRRSASSRRRRSQVATGRRPTSLRRPDQVGPLPGAGGPGGELAGDEAVTSGADTPRPAGELVAPDTPGPGGETGDYWALPPDLPDGPRLEPPRPMPDPPEVTIAPELTEALPDLPRRQGSFPVPERTAAVDAGPAGRDVTLDFLSGLHDRFRKEIDGEADSDEQPPPQPVTTSRTVPGAPSDRLVPEADRSMGGVPEPVPVALDADPGTGEARTRVTARDVGAAVLARIGGAQRSRRVVGAVGLVGVFVLAIAAIAIGRSGDDLEGASTGTGSTPPADAGAATTGSVPPPSPPDAFAQAAERLRSAGSFTYTGTAHATDVSRVRPGLWLAVDVVIAGEVDVAGGQVHETAVALTGGAAETVTDGTNAWGRSAPSPAELPEQAYQATPELTAPEPGPMGAALLPVWLGFAAGYEDAGPDDQGRPTYRATVPAAVLGAVESGPPSGDARIVLTLDGTGAPVRVRIFSLPDGADLDLSLEVASIGQPVDITPPAG
jgi:hypothetical protein